MSVYSILQSLALSALDARGAESAPKESKVPRFQERENVLLKVKGPWLLTV